MSSGWPPSPTATASAPPTSRSFLATIGAPASERRPRTEVPGGTPHDHHRAPAARGHRHLRVRLVRLRRRRRRAPARSVRGRRPRHLGEEERAGVDARHAAEGPALFEQEAHADLGLGPVRHRLRQHQVLRALDREAGRSWTTCPPTSRTPTTSWASRRPRSSGWSPVSRRSTSPRSSTTRSTRNSRSRA